ncbi:regulator of chromosome condensation 1/beta-lactamase-inhibitor protein II [Podospora didyma]|uniref:Regulator of chromosome condensation 1/beta-lactamase-inhibitor protein II n=1 Tax=Podospora didyma TaxID=330526 RepID=A0AAE0JYY9_9PEZI|nr:regulator of chromosome condensation 1/beta-lactamase-inhibitor protein II [Podospora didyma]
MHEDGEEISSPNGAGGKKSAPEVPLENNTINKWGAAFNLGYPYGKAQECITDADPRAQLTRRLLERDIASALYPSGIGSLPDRARPPSSLVAPTIGLNNYAELGVSNEAGQDGGDILKPQFISSLEGYDVADIAGGEHHSLACTTDGQLLTWGRIDGRQVGQPEETYKEDNTVWDENNKPRILLYPQPVPSMQNIVQVAAGTDHSFAVTSECKVFSWAFRPITRPAMA